MVLERNPTSDKEQHSTRCYHATTPTASASPLTTTVWWPMRGWCCPPHWLDTWAFRNWLTGIWTWGDAPGRANAGDKLVTLVASALAGGDCIDDADALRCGGTGRVLGVRSRLHPPLGPSCAVSAGATCANWTG